MRILFAWLMTIALLIGSAEHGYSASPTFAGKHINCIFLRGKATMGLWTGVMGVPNLNTKGAHGLLCMSDDGEILGGLMTTSERLRCIVHGFYDVGTGCFQLGACHEEGAIFCP